MDPVVIIGAGPQGLAAAAHLVERGLTPARAGVGRGPGLSRGRLGSRAPLLAVARAGGRGRPAPVGVDWLDRPAGGVSDPNLHSCGSVRATGAADLAHPEPGFYIVGAKSYGRAPTFLAVTGYEQVRSVVAELAGDHEAAARVELELPDTGVCGGSGLFDAPDDQAAGGCCSPAPQLVQLDLGR